MALIETNKIYLDEESFLKIDDQKATLDGFDQLWQATEDSLPENYKAPLERLLDEKDEQILYLNDIVNILTTENFKLRQEMAGMQSKFEVYEKVCSDYVGTLELNRALTKQLNNIMGLREREQNQIKALKTLLA